MAHATNVLMFGVFRAGIVGRDAGAGRRLRRTKSRPSSAWTVWESTDTSLV